MGGFTANGSEIADAELFEHRQARFIRLPAPPIARHSHTATSLRDGTVLIAGGMTSGGTYSDAAELYDPRTRTFRPVGRLAAPRSGHQAVALDDGRVLLIGGVGTDWTFLATAEIYDPRTRTFAPTGSMAEARESHVAIKLGGGRVLVAGGHRGRRADIVISRTAEVFDVATGRFGPVGDMGVRRHKHDGVALADGRVLVVGGSDERDSRGVYTSTEVFDPAIGRFRPAGVMQLARFKHNGASLVLTGSTVLLAGGATQAEEYDAASGTSVIVGGEARMTGQFSAAARLPAGRVLVTGGYGENIRPTSGAWVYVP